MAIKPIKLFNTLTRRKEIFKPIKDKMVNMFICGPTTYDYSHVGHARTYVIFDFLAKYLKTKGYKINLLMNITDIDDKIINKALKEGKSWKKVSQFYEKEFFKDLKRLGINSISKFAKASDHIHQIIKQIKTLIRKGFAYSSPAVKINHPQAVEGENFDVYFDISKFKDYGNLSGQKLEKMEFGKRIKTEENKKDPRDFVLWKAQNFKYEPFWFSPWGRGRPGWHIEDTAISEKYFGQQYDIHCGAYDLIFPHHEAEIAQQESASGKKPFVRYWLHSGLVTVNKQKMSKSLGNFIIISGLLKKYSSQAIRLMILSTHYRSPIDYKENLIKQSEAGINRIRELIEKLKFIIKTKKRSKTAIKDVKNLINKTQKDIEKNLDDDLNTPKALAVLFNFIKKTNILIGKDKIDENSSKMILNFLEKINNIFGIIPLDKKFSSLLAKDKKNIPKEILELIQKREALRSRKLWKEADEIREQIKLRGYEVEDTIYGPLVRKVVK